MDDKLYKKALNLEYLTVGYNVIEAFFSILFGADAGSIALVGFGLDSMVESISGLILIWRLRKHNVYSAGQAGVTERGDDKRKESHKICRCHLLLAWSLRAL